MTSLEVSRPRSLPNGWWGMLVFVAGEATLFGCLLGSYFYLRLLSVDWPQGGIEPKDPLMPLILVAALATTSIFMQLASRAALRGRGGAAFAALLLALVVQSGYFAFGVHDFRADLATFSPQDSAYASIYFTLLGADHAHVALGLLLDAWLLVRLLGGLTPYRVTALRAVTLYWHAVNAITVVVTPTILSPSA
jgi:heme/copper-type cytochrome/quinol oxidase subunit 3